MIAIDMRSPSTNFIGVGILNIKYWWEREAKGKRETFNKEI